MKHIEIGMLVDVFFIDMDWEILKRLTNVDYDFKQLSDLHDQSILKEEAGEPGGFIGRVVEKITIYTKVDIIELYGIEIDSKKYIIPHMLTILSIHNGATNE